ncbi:unnamed protein product [Rhizoctonia solani]|uniref:Tyrosinase copper-binding domain-containing protein n=1 Tax=Rhizoctonia solani TaxID=456999 RepID=A0A8H3C753_9AGAM|nr:unnamed protein product [Rhizoctonia solani]
MPRHPADTQNVIVSYLYCALEEDEYTDSVDLNFVDVRIFFSSLSLALFQVTSATDTSTLGSGKCKSIEVRKEWRTLSKPEKRAWIKAVNCLNRTPRSGKLNPPVNTSAYSAFDFIVPVSPEATYYDELVYTHMNLNPLIHFTGLFLPFHRLYVHEWTNALRSQCGYKGVAPYWAWEYGM